MNNPAHPRRYSFVTVGFEGDAGLLCLQARSMRLYCPPELIEEIIIVDNWSSGAKKWRSNLLQQYGSLARFVRILPAASIVAIPAGASGWYTQQVLKIKVAETIRSERYVVLDAKNHMIKQLGREFLETPTGQPRINGKPYTNHPMREFLERTLEYLGLDPQTHISWFTRTHPPFTILTDEARELIRHVEQKEAGPFASAFLDRKLSEFFLYSGFLVSKGTLRSIYNLEQPEEAQVWPGDASESACAKAIVRTTQTESPFMTVHRQAIAKMDQRGQQLIADFWYSRGLFATAKDGVRFLRDPNRSYQNRDGQVVSWPMSQIVSRFSSRSERQLQTFAQ
jgi:Family of unknown function (DUF6492)